MTIPNSVTSIENHAFYGCSGLTSMTIPSGVTSFGSNAFHGCSGLTSVTIPSGVTSIGDHAFYGCSGLTSVTIPNSVTRIGNHAFYGCSGLNSVTIPSGVTSIENYAFHGCSGLTSVTIPSGVTNIGGYAFYGCSGLTSMTIPSGVTSFGSNAFHGCSGLTSVTIPNGVTSIESNAFDGCSGLTSITIPSRMVIIGSNAFSGCKLRSVVCRATNAPSITSDAFPTQTLDHTTLLVPVGAWENYAKDDTWHSFSKIREAAMDTESISNTQAFLIREVESESYLCIDKENGTISTIGVEGLEENDPNNSWMVATVDGKHYVYNLGAKKYLVNIGAFTEHAPSTQNALTLTDKPTPINIYNGDSGVMTEICEFYFVINDNLNVEKNLENKIEEATGIAGVASDMNEDTPAFSIDGRKVTSDKPGIIIKNGKKYIK